MKEFTKTIIRLWDFFFSVFSVTFEWGEGGRQFSTKVFPCLRELLINPGLPLHGSSCHLIF